jgi:hypothetical protein
VTTYIPLCFNWNVPWLNKLLQRSERKARRHQEAQFQALLPANKCNDDTYLVSFPKAGVTWLSFLIANTNLRLSNYLAYATSWNIHDYVPDIHVTRNVSARALPVPGCRFIKSHADFNPYYYKVVYLVRDPRATLISYYDMATKLAWFHGPMDEFLASEKFGIMAWVRHVEGWITLRDPATRINFIRYEDLKKNPVDVLTRLYRLFGVDADRAVLEAVVTQSSFARMKADEEFYKEQSQERNPAFQFMRRGEASGFSQELSPAQIARIESGTKEWMKLFGYECIESAENEDGISKGSKRGHE